MRSWVKQHEIDGRARPGVPTAEARRVKEHEQEVRELRRANEMAVHQRIRTRSPHSFA